MTEEKEKKKQTQTREEFTLDFCRGTLKKRTLGKSYYVVKFPTCDIMMGDTDHKKLHIVAIKLPSLVLLTDHSVPYSTINRIEIPHVYIESGTLSWGMMNNEKYDITDTAELNHEGLGYRIRFLGKELFLFKLAQTGLDVGLVKPEEVIMKDPTTRGKLHVTEWIHDEAISFHNFFFGENDAQKIIERRKRKNFIVPLSHFEPPPIPDHIYKDLELGSLFTFSNVKKGVQLYMEKRIRTRASYSSSPSPELREWEDARQKFEEAKDYLEDRFDAYIGSEIVWNPGAEVYHDRQTGEVYYRGPWKLLVDQAHPELLTDHTEDWCKIIPIEPKVYMRRKPNK